MDTDIFCVLCGNPFDLENDIYNIDSTAAKFKWIRDVRILGSTRAMHTMLLTASTATGVLPKNLSGSKTVFLSEEIRWVSTDADFFHLDGSYYNVLCRDIAGNALFPLHYTCLELGCRVFRSQSEADSGGLTPYFLEMLNDMLKQRFKHRAGSAKHDLDHMFNLKIDCDDYGPRSLLALNELGWWSGAYEKFLTDPLDVPGIAAFIFDILVSLPRAKDVYIERPYPEGKLRPLETLPNELLDRINDYLPAHSVIALHDTSRALAYKIRLDDRFWRTQLLSGSLIPQIWDINPRELEVLQDEWKKAVPTDSARWNWRSLIRILKKTRIPIAHRETLLENIPKGYWNRCRIWNIMNEAFSQREMMQ